MTTAVTLLAALGSGALAVYLPRRSRADPLLAARAARPAALALLALAAWLGARAASGSLRPAGAFGTGLPLATAAALPLIGLAALRTAASLRGGRRAPILWAGLALSVTAAAALAATTSFTAACAGAAIACLALAAFHAAPVYRRGWPRHRTEAIFLASAVAVVAGTAVIDAALARSRSVAVPTGAALSVALLARVITLRADPRLLLRARALLAESLGHSVVVVDGAGAVVAISDAARELFGLADATTLPTALRERIADPHCRASEFNLGGPGPAARQFEVRIAQVPEAGWPEGSRVIAIREITSQREIEQRLERLAYCDDLTGLPNRRRFLEELAESIAGGGDEPPPVSLLHLDLDRLKEINERVGHSAGDELLRVVAQRLRQHAMRGPGAMVARLGGDEFAIALRGVGEEAEARAAAERLLSVVAEPMWVNEQKLGCTASVGVSILPRDAGDLDELLLHSDAALHEAKQSGRNRCEVFDARLGAASARKNLLKQGLADAAARGEMRLHYQPIVDLVSRRAVGAEALLRWTHPEAGEVPPKEFIPLAEAFGAIVPLGEWVFLEACRQIRRWRESGLDVLPVTVNVSSHQLAEPRFGEHVAALLAQFEVAPSLLQLDLTEDAFFRESGESARTLRELRAIGVRVSLDDFGTGRSALASLTRAPLDILKLDPMLLRDVDTDDAAANVVRAVIAMARGLGLRTVAEGVDRESLVPVLYELGCEEAQGFLFGAAVPGDEFVNWLAGEDLPTRRPADASRASVGAATEEDLPSPRSAPAAPPVVPAVPPVAPAVPPAVPAATPAAPAATSGEAARASQPLRYALLVDDDDGVLGPVALRLTRLGVLALYTRFPDEAHLLATQEREHVRSVIASPRTVLRAVQGVIHTLAAAHRGCPPSVVVVGAPSESESAEFRALGAAWRIAPDARDEELRFVVNQALAMPEELHRRSALRAPANVDVSLDVDGVRRPGILTSIGEGGAFVELAEPWPTGTGVLLGFELGDLPIVAEARVVHVNERESSIAPSFPRGMGVEFTRIEADAVQEIARWTKTTLERYRL